MGAASPYNRGMADPNAPERLRQEIEALKKLLGTFGDVNARFTSLSAQVTALAAAAPTYQTVTIGDNNQTGTLPGLTGARRRFWGRVERRAVPGGQLLGVFYLSGVVVRDGADIFVFVLDNSNVNLTFTADANGVYGTSPPLVLGFEQIVYVASEVMST